MIDKKWCYGLTEIQTENWIISSFAQEAMTPANAISSDKHLDNAERILIGLKSAGVLGDETYEEEKQHISYIAKGT